MAHKRSTSLEQGELWSVAQVSIALKRTRDCLYKWRKAGKGPAYIKIGSQIWYPKDQLDAYLNSGLTLTRES